MSTSQDDNASAQASSDHGVVPAITGFAAGLAEHVGKRVELFFLELRHAGMHIGVLVGLTVLALFSVFLGYLFLAISAGLFVAAATGWSWALVILFIAASHLTVALMCGLILWVRVKRPILPASLKEFQKDSEWLRNSKNRN